MSQIEAPKIVQSVVFGPPADTAIVSKLVMYVILRPGAGDDESNRQGHVHSQIARRS
jgi:hypothetical protein